MSWPLVKLAELCHVVTKGTTPTSIGYDFSNTGIPFLRIQNLYSSTVCLDDVLYINEETHAALGRSVIKPKDFLITIAGTIGRVAIVPDDFPESNCNQAIAILRFDNNKLWPTYLLHWITTQDAMSQIAGKKVTATISNLSLGQIKELEIPLPPLPEQKRLATILDKADAIRRKRQQAIKLADDFLRSVFLEMFGDPVTNSKGWEVRKLGDVSELINGDRSSNYPSGDDLKECGVLFLNTKNITNGKIELVDPVFITEEKFNSLSRGKLQQDDLVITLRGTLGSCAIFDTEYKTGFINAQLMIIRPKIGIMSDFLHAFLTSNQIQDAFQSLGRGAAVPQLTGAQMKELDMYIPSLELMDKFTKIKNTVSDVKFKCNVATKSELFESLSQKAFSGHL